jgi:hypothetical protein
MHHGAVDIVLALLFSPKLSSLAALLDRKIWRWRCFGGRHNPFPDF